MSSIASLAQELRARRAELLAALDALPRERLPVPIMAAWTAPDLVWHVAFWTGHGAHAIELVIGGRGGAFDYDPSRTDAMNAGEASRGAGVTLHEARDREAAAMERFTTALARLDDVSLMTRLGNGHALEDVIRYDGPDHYAEHAAHLRLA